jgi:4-amino-4-deoxy-L-arabinose transferase-like glycosyltransferase
VSGGRLNRDYQARLRTRACVLGALGDALSHSDAAAAGRGYHIGHLPTAYRPVGYSAALAIFVKIFGEDPSVARFFNAGLAVVTLPALFIITRHLTDSTLAGLIALFIFAFYPSDIGYTSVPLSEQLFSALALSAIAVYLSDPQSLRHAASAGALIAWATLTRPQGILLVPTVLLGLVFSRHRVGRYGLVLLTALILTMAPWWIRNANAFGAFVPVSTNGGINLLIGNHPEANGSSRRDSRFHSREHDHLRRYALPSSDSAVGGGLCGLRHGRQPQRVAAKS